MTLWNKINTRLLYLDLPRPRYADENTTREVNITSEQELTGIGQDTRRRIFCT